MTRMKTETETRSEPDTRSERERFEDFTRRLMKVPKHEIDKEAVKYEKQKAKRLNGRAHKR
jgi:hypothetical protein